jgi:anhydro-N-acetylmuramic acid kinase
VEKKKHKTIKKLIGLMSGTSLDGLDIVYVQFTEKDEIISYKLIYSKTVDYSDELESKIKKSATLGLAEIQILDKAIGLFYAQEVQNFIDEFHIDPKEITAIASHGQTILHQPENGFTLQIGCGGTLAYHTGVNVINDFRTKDVIAGGQGAPLVPIGDFDLFHKKASSFLNIGGFCNISFKTNDVIQAFDICPGNLPLNKFSNELGAAFDKDGYFASEGKLNAELLERLNDLDYYNQPNPKSLGTEWLEASFYPKIQRDLITKDIIHTLCVHYVEQIAKVLNQENISSVFVSGGGAKNKFITNALQKQFNGEVIIPGIETIDFKEAIIFAYLGYCYILNKPTTIQSVTGSTIALSTGVLHKPGYPTYPQS